MTGFVIVTFDNVISFGWAFVSFTSVSSTSFVSVVSFASVSFVSFVSFASVSFVSFAF